MTSLRNDQVALLALLQLGGALHAVDTEDIAIEADRLAPGRFRWRKYPDHIDLGLVRNGLQDARKLGLTAGGARKGWTLTDEGKQESEAIELLSGDDAARERRTLQLQAWITRERTRLLREPTFIQATRDGVGSLSARDILRLFKIDEYVPSEKRTSRLKQFASAFSDDPIVGPVLAEMERRVRE